MTNKYIGLYVLAKHEGCKKEFVFEVPPQLEVKRGDALIVDTMYGEQLATAVTDTFGGINQEEVLKRLGAYSPVKQVKAVCDRRFTEFIENKVRQEIYEAALKFASNEILADLPY